MKRKATKAKARPRKLRSRIRYRRTAIVPNFLKTKRFVYASTVSGADSGLPLSQGLALTFQLNDLGASISDFSNTFDQYRITGIRYRWSSIKNNAYTGSTLSNTGYFPRIMWAYDWNDVVVPAGFAELQQYDNVKEVYLTDARPVSRWYYFRPKALNQMAGGYQTATGNQWLRMNETGVFHYGIKAFYDSNYANQQLRLECYYYLEFKSVK